MSDTPETERPTNPYEELKVLLQKQSESVLVAARIDEVTDGILAGTSELTVADLPEIYYLAMIECRRHYGRLDPDARRRAEEYKKKGLAVKITLYRQQH